MGNSNRSRTPNWVPKSALSAAITRVAESESPPRSKKDDSASTTSVHSTRASTPATACSSGVRGGRAEGATEPNSGAGRAARSSFFVGVSGTSSKTVITAGTM